MELRDDLLQARVAPFARSTFLAAASSIASMCTRGSSSPERFRRAPLSTSRSSSRDLPVGGHHQVHRLAERPVLGDDHRVSAASSGDGGRLPARAIDGRCPRLRSWSRSRASVELESQIGRRQTIAASRASPRHRARHHGIARTTTASRATPWHRARYPGIGVEYRRCIL